jgi:hypothetical protein
MKEKVDNRRRLLYTLVQYAEKSKTFNPHFYRCEMMKRLDLTEGEFNIVQKQLGDRDCRYVDQHEGDARYEIRVSECLTLRDQFEQEKIQERRHKQLFWIAVLAVVFAALGAALTLWFQTR